MKKNEMREAALTAHRVRRILQYDHETGIFTWLIDSGGRAQRGSQAGSRTPGRYVQITIDGFPYMAHRIAWLYVRGEWPKVILDHKNGVKDDNRWANLRAASFGENSQNRRKSARNKSGFTGVCWNKKRRRWEVSIKVNGRKKYLGDYDDAREAADAYLAEKRAIHPFFVEGNGNV